MLERMAMLTSTEMNRVLADASHELRNLVCVVRGEAQLGIHKYQKSLDAERMLLALNNIVKHTDEMIIVLDKKLDAARSSS